MLRKPLPPARIPAPPRPELTLSGRLGDLRALLAPHGDIPLRVLVRDMSADMARADAPDAAFPAR
jgi:hypothetical protein